MSRKSEPPDDREIVTRKLPSDPAEAFDRDPRSEEARQRRDVVRRQQTQLIRRFVHDHARALHVLAARLVGPRDAGALARASISHLALRVQQQSLAETQALASAPRWLWRLTCEIMAYRAHDHLNHGRADHELDGSWLERAHDTLSPTERVLFILHYYYRFSEIDFESMFHLHPMQSRRLVYRALHRLKRAIREQRVKQ
jgi:DNA-directed RNA polymerase specialized sigma24 family protein